MKYLLRNPFKIIQLPIIIILAIVTFINLLKEYDFPTIINNREFISEEIDKALAKHWPLNWIWLVSLLAFWFNN